jgi:hypothetical protein
MPLHLRIALDQTAVWREVVVQENLTLGGLHLVIQQAMGWENRHLYRFDVNGKHYGPDDLDVDAFTLKQVFKTKSISYVYDFGDWWEHTVTLVETVPKMAETLVTAGQGICPDEDSGGV